MKLLAMICRLDQVYVNINDEIWFNVMLNGFSLSLYGGARLVYSHFFPLTYNKALVFKINKKNLELFVLVVNYIVKVNYLLGSNITIIS